MFAAGICVYWVGNVGFKVSPYLSYFCASVSLPTYAMEVHRCPSHAHRGGITMTLGPAGQIRPVGFEK